MLFFHFGRRLLHLQTLDILLRNLELNYYNFNNCKVFPRFLCKYRTTMELTTTDSNSVPALSENNCKPNSSNCISISISNDTEETTITTMAGNLEEFDESLSQQVQESAKPTLSKKALKRQARAQQYKLKKRMKMEKNLIQTGREEAGFCLKEFDQTSYYFERGLRKVYPYPFVFSTHAKGRWVGRTLKQVLEKEFGFDKLSDVDKAFDRGKIHVNGKQVCGDYVVKDCDFISHQIHRHENPVTGSELEILADTEDVVVINKPSSIPCHPCGRYRFNSVVFILGKEMGYANLRNIYRLDRLTSGVLVLGKTVETTKRLEDQVVRREVHKEYLCRVEGEFPLEPVTVDKPLAALSNKLRLQIISATGKASQTTFSRLSYNGQSSVVKCVPHTGRTHQIRVHLQYLGHPIINDSFYNSDAWGPNKGKGGNYSESHDLVCTRILALHHATQWEGGDNPHFHLKLAEMEQLNRHASEAEMEKTEMDAPTSPQTSTPDKATVVRSWQNNNADCQAGSVGDEEVGNSMTGAQLPAEHSDETGDPSEDGGKLPLGFEWSKWQVDPSCDLCRKTCRDPRPKDLVMFLHAWKYKGPGWEYQTELPDWADQDWANEEEYQLDTALQSDPDPK